MCDWKQTLEYLLDSGSIGIYQCCQVDQIVLLDVKTNIAWNYFTHVHFAGKYNTEEESVLLRSPVSLKNGLKLYISRYFINKEKFIECVKSALLTGIWNYTDSQIDQGDKIDGAFPTSAKYVSENDPTGSLYNNVIPLAKSLYQSTFIGNFYIFEIYARGDHLKTMLSTKEVKHIQSILQKCKMNYGLDELTDRIGNVVCRFDIETLKVSPKKLGKLGMIYSYELAPNIESEFNIRFHTEQEHDKLIYKYEDEDICLKSGQVIERGVVPNQCKTTITVTDLKTNLILFRTIADQSVYSSYRGQITPDAFVATPVHEYRKIKLNGDEHSIPLQEINFLGELEFFVEMSEAGKRQKMWEDTFFRNKKYFNIYSVGEHDKALADIRSIINKQLFWDLQEIRIIDPYLAPLDILNTAAFCEKRDIRVCCLTDLHTISRNKTAKEEILDEEFEKNRENEDDEYNYAKILLEFKQQLEEGLGQNSDLRLSFRTVHGNNGMSFHDRYLILKYKINKTRVWSLGTSINSVGKSHHIIQIVESPLLIDGFFDEVWQQTETDECKIYDYSDYVVLK